MPQRKAASGARGRGHLRLAAGARAFAPAALPRGPKSPSGPRAQGLPLLEGGQRGVPTLEKHARRSKAPLPRWGAGCRWGRHGTLVVNLSGALSSSPYASGPRPAAPGQAGDALSEGVRLARPVARAPAAGVGVRRVPGRVVEHQHAAGGHHPPLCLRPAGGGSGRQAVRQARVGVVSQPRYSRKAGRSPPLGSPPTTACSAPRLLSAYSTQLTNPDQLRND
jgi:hypothetical protein